MPKPIRIPPPMTLADLLVRRFGSVNDTALAIARQRLIPAIASGARSAIDAAIEAIARALAEVNEENLRRQAEDVAARVSDRHRKLFFAGVAAVIGMRIIGSDLPDEPAAAAGGLGALGVGGIGSGGIPAPWALPRRRRKGVVLVKLSAEPRLLAQEFATKNAQLIKTLSEEIVPSMRDEVVRSVIFGYSPEEAAARLEAKWAQKGLPVARGNYEPRVRQIVRDQVSKLNTDLTGARCRAAGISEFTWTSQRDSRVRPLHRELDGQIFSFATGHPTEGLPGQPVNCRCFAVPVVNPTEVLRAPGFVHLASAGADEIAA